MTTDLDRIKLLQTAWYQYKSDPSAANVLAFAEAARLHFEAMNQAYVTQQEKIRKLQELVQSLDFDLGTANTKLELLGANDGKDNSKKNDADQSR